MMSIPRSEASMRGVFASVLAGMVGGCTIGPSLEMPLSIQPSARLEIYWVHIYKNPKGLLVTGRVRRPSINMAPLWGHLHFAGVVDTGTPSPSVDARIGAVPARGNRSASFSALLRTDRPQDIRSVSISYRAAADTGPGKK